MNPFAAELSRVKHATDFIDLINTNFHSCSLAPSGPELAAAFERYLGSDIRPYTPDPAGSQALRTTLAERYPGTSPGQFVVTASASESYEHLFRALIPMSSTVLLPSPGYPLFEEVAKRCGHSVASYELGIDRQWQPDAQRMVESIQRTRPEAVVLISPNNPTGRALDPSIAQAIAAACEETGALLILDEVFSSFVYETAPDHVRLTDLAPNARTATINGASKLLASPDLKVSWIMIDGPTVDEDAEALQVENDLFLNGSPINQAVVAHLLANREDITTNVVAKVASRRNVMLDALQGMSDASRSRCRWVDPDSGIHLPIEVSLPVGQDDESLSVALLDTEHLCTHPGYLYGFSADTLVVSFLSKETSIREGVSRLDRYLSGL